MIEGMIKGVLTLVQHLFNQPMATGKFVIIDPLCYSCKMEILQRSASFVIK